MTRRLSGEQPSIAMRLKGAGMTSDNAVAEALEEAAQAAMQPDIPLAAVPDVVAALQGRGMRSVMEARVRGIALHGHSAENDDMLPIGWLPMEARNLMESARSAMGAHPRDLAEVRGTLVAATAICLAAIDRLDRATGMEG